MSRADLIARVRELAAGEPDYDRSRALALAALELAREVEVEVRMPPLCAEIRIRGAARVELGDGRDERRLMIYGTGLVFIDVSRVPDASLYLSDIGPGGAVDVLLSPSPRRTP